MVSQVPIVYPNRVWFAGWSARLLLYTPANPGSLSGQPGSYCIPQLSLVHWDGQPGSYDISQPTLVCWVVSQVLIVYPNRPMLAGWSARFILCTPTNPGSLGGQPGSYCIPQPTLVCWMVSQVPIVYPNQPWFAGWSAPYLQKVLYIGI